MSALRKGLPIFLLVALLAPLSPTRAAGKAGEPKDMNAPTADWYEGPVRYLLTAEEQKSFRSLTTNEDRIRFTEDFWARRDEDPSTPANEFEIRFWKRVEEADHLFRDAPYPGWKTDRGKLYVLLGPPDEIRPGRAHGWRGKEVFTIIWIYHQPRFEGMARDTEIRFLQDDSGEYHITDRLFLNRLEVHSGVPRLLVYQAMAAQKPPEPRELLDAIATARPPMDEKQFRTRYDFFKAADGSTSVTLTVGGRRASDHASPDKAAAAQTRPSDAWKVFARLAGATGSYDLVEPTSFRTSEVASDVEGFRLYQGRISVPPGEYTVFYGFQTEGSDELISFTDRLRVPDFTRGSFALSGITLASRLEPAENPGPEEPFVIGRLLVVPKLQPGYQTGQEMAFYFQVYHPQFDPDSGEARLDLTYEFLQAREIRKTGEPVYSPVGKPLVLGNQVGLVHGYAFELKGWPAGAFRLKVTAKDLVANRTVSAEADFTVR